MGDDRGLRTPPGGDEAAMKARAHGRVAVRDAGGGRPIAFDKVAGVVVTGNEDGAHHCIAEIAGALNDIGYTIPGQA